MVQGNDPVDKITQTFALVFILFDDSKHCNSDDQADARGHEAVQDGPGSGPG